MDKKPFKTGETLYVGVNKFNQPYNNTNFLTSADDAIDEYVNISGEDPTFVLELQVTRVGGFTRTVKWGE